MITVSYEDIQEDIVSCTNEIFSTMIPMEIKSDGSFYQKEDMISTDVISLVSFTGEHSGIVAIFCSRGIALKITSSMLGIEVSQMDQDTKDAMGEVANMIAGTLKNKIFEGIWRNASLRGRIVIAGGDLTISSSSNKDDQRVSVSSGVTCDSQNSWLMTPFSSGGETFNIGFVIKKND